MKAYGWSRVLTPLIVNLHASTALSPGKKFRYHLNSRLYVPQSSFGLAIFEVKNKNKLYSIRVYFRKDAHYILTFILSVSYFS